MGAAQLLKKIVLSKQSMYENDREEVLAFLGNGQNAAYAPQSGEITGILKEMGGEMSRDLASATSEEETSIKDYEELMAAKKKEVNALTASIETKTQRIGELAVAIVQMKDDLSDTEAALLADKGFLAELEKGCATKTAEWEEIVKTRADELAALAETIKVLNDDDALELFKKTLPSASLSLIQFGVDAATLRNHALASLQQDEKKDIRLDFIGLALRGKKIGFEKIIKMIDDMVATLKKEQLDDDHKKEYCIGQLDLSDDKKKSTERASSYAENAIDSAEQGIATLTEEIAALEAGIRALDKSVMEATEQRKQEHKEYNDLMASNTAAKELLMFAKNRLNKFYNPKLYKPPPKRELSAEDHITTGLTGTEPPTEAPGGIADTGISVSFAQVNKHLQDKVAPPPPPETFGAYSKKTEENTGVIAMIDLLIKDLDKEMTEAETEEKDSQADYEEMMK